jgi:hypothetical protein
MLPPQPAAKSWHNNAKLETQAVELEAALEAAKEA